MTRSLLDEIENSYGIEVEPYKSQQSEQEQVDKSVMDDPGSHTRHRKRYWQQCAHYN